MNTTDRIVDILIREGGYRELPKPLKVGSLTIDFDHALVASARGNDLVIVIEVKSDTADDLVIRRITSLTRALDVLQSRRPVTAVLASGQVLSETIQAISRVCRVLPIGAPTGPSASDTVRDWLSVLLPLQAPQPVVDVFDWKEELRTAVGREASQDLLDEFIEAAVNGKKAVETVFAGMVRRAIKPVDDALLEPEL